MLLRLNEVTEPHHERADAPWLALLAPDVRREAYIRQLVATYGFEAPIESALSYTKGLCAVVKLRERARSGLIAQDLLVLGLTPTEVTELRQCFSIASFEDIGEALGWLYVVERAALHHEKVRRNISQRIPSARKATSFLAAAGSIAGRRWQALGMVIDKYATTTLIADRIVTAADNAFRRLHLWNETHHSDVRSEG